MKNQKNNLVIFVGLYWNPILLLYRLPLVPLLKVTLCSVVVMVIVNVVGLGAAVTVVPFVTNLQNKVARKINLLPQLSPTNFPFSIKL